MNPAYYQPVGTLFPFINNDQSLSQTGLYVQDQMKFGGFRLTLGTRHDWTEQSNDNRISATKTSQESDKQTYRAGLLYLFDNGLAPMSAIRRRSSRPSASAATACPSCLRPASSMRAG